MTILVYNKRGNIRTSSQVERLFSTANGFIGRLENVEYKNTNGSWSDQGSRWLINEDDPQLIMDVGHKSTKL